MSIFFLDKPAYAETHYKFKLPWSLLYRPWPEIFFDAPFQFQVGSEKKIWVIIKDAHRFPVLLKQVKISLKNHETEINFEKTLDIFSDSPLAFYPIELGELPPGDYTVFPEITVQKKDKTKTFKRWNFPFLSPKPLQFKVLKEELPIPEGYFAGEMHCHTRYSSDQIEFGASPQVLQEAASAVGLDFVCCTDHAYDFAFSESDYLKEANPVSRFDSLKKEIHALKKTPLMLAGEEVSAGNSEGENVHMTVFAPENYISGLGDCGRYWLKNEPTISISKVLESTESPCFAAHPKAPMGFLEKFIFRRGYWNSKDLKFSKKQIRGIQFWNGSRDEGFFEGKKFWIEELGKGNFLLPIGGNDAHGDLNDCVSVKIPLFSLRYERNHVFGKVRTVVKAKDLTEEELKAAFQTHSVYITDGPALWWEKEGDSFKLYAHSNEELGIFKSIKIFARTIDFQGKLSQSEILLPESVVLAPLKNEISVRGQGYAYLRAEASSEKGFFALTAAQPV